jgi:hypothetical protein
LNGYVNEVIVYNSNLSDSDRQQVEDYLSRKWNVTLSRTILNLPSSHPFRLAPPVLRPFVPTDIANCALWLDAADPRTLTLSGSNVTAWADKSGLGNNASTSGTYPVYASNGLNGNGTIAMRSSNDYFVVSSNFTTTAYPSLCYFIVVRPATTQPNTTYAGILSTDSLGVYGRSLGLGSNNWQQEYYSGFTNITPYTAEQWYVVSLQFVGTTSATLSINGMTYSGTASATGSNTTGLKIGSYVDAGSGNYALYNANIDIAEIAVFGAALSTTQRQQVEAYLANKWGLQGNTPSTHPARISPGLSPQFMPTLLSNCALWLDAADQKTLTLSGSNVTAWTDKSGNGRNATQSTGSNQPVFSNNAIVFNGAQNLISTLSASLSSETIFVVLNASTPPNGAPCILGSIAELNNNVGGTGGRSFDFLQSSSTLRLLRQFTAVLAEGAYTSFNSRALVGTLTNGTNAFVYSNATQIGTGAFTAYTSGLYTIIGRNGNGTTQYFAGQMNEIVVFSSALSTAERQQVEGYLATKWGLQGSLPSTHPYKLTTLL